MWRSQLIPRCVMAWLLAAAPLGHCAADASPRLAFDGRFDDWPAGTTALADPYYFYFRLSLPAVVGLQAAEITTELLIDLDGDPGTGRSVKGRAPDAPLLGAELALVFAPRDARSAQGLPSGAAAEVYAVDGSPTPLAHQQLAFAALPTHASDVFELRLARHALRQHEVAGRLRTAGQARAMFRRVDAGGLVVWESALMSFDRPVAAARPPRAGTIPARPADSIRIMSINVRWGGPLADPGPLARIVAAADPDVVLLQEWERRGEREKASSAARTEALAHWFNTHVPGDPPWRARRSQAPSVAVVARAELSPLGRDRVAFQEPEGVSEPARRRASYIAARVDSPLGPVAVASIHLRCCGAPGSVEDREREAEAAAVHAAFKDAVAAADLAMVVIGGDFNLVGHPHPQAMIAAALDLDGSALAVAPALAPGDRGATTWRDPRSRFSPSQLDFLLYSDASAALLNAFVIDTAALSDATLRRAGLLRDDAAFSDHLAVVIDLRRRAERAAPAGVRDQAKR